MAELLNVPCFLNPTIQNSTIYNFDKKITVEATGADGKKIDVFIFINTSNGNVGSISGKPGSLGNGEISINNEKFSLTIQQPNGIMTTFYNSKVKSELVHTYTTLNFEMFPMEIGQPNTTIHKTGDRKTVLTQGFTAGEYSGSGANGSTYICGAISQNQFTISKFIGYGSIGYAKTNHGIVMIVENSSPDASFKALKWQDGNYTFDSAEFQSTEGEMYTKANESINQKIEKISNKESTTENCRDLEEELKRVKLENLNKQKDAINRSKSGN